MVEPAARIRLFEPKDRQTVRFAIGKANMESLAKANQHASRHISTLSIWVALSCAFVEIMQSWPNPDAHGYLGYLSPLPAFACIAFLLLAIIDWFNRPYFEKLTQDAFRRADIPAISSYYSRSKASGFWILELGDNFVGLIGLDASADATSNEPLTTDTDENANPNRKASNGIATIRHFFVDEPYRVTGIQVDLLSHAIKHAFENDPALEIIKCTDSPLTPYVRESLQKVGFKFESYVGQFGIFKWPFALRSLNRADFITVGDDKKVA